jgi:hypothetical protein
MAVPHGERLLVWGEFAPAMFGKPVKEVCPNFWWFGKPLHAIFGTTL